MPRHAFAPVAALLCACAHAAPPPSPPPAPPVHTADENEAPPTLQLPKDVRPTHYTVALDVDPAQAGFHGVERIAVRLDRPRRAVWLHARGLAVTVARVTLADGTTVEGKLAQANDDGLAKLTLPAPVGPGDASIEFAWSASYSPTLDGLYKVRVGQDAYAVTQMEMYAARRALPCFDEPAFKTPFDVTLTVPDGLVAVANTAPLAETVDGKRRTIRFGTTRPLPTYLLAWTVGPWDVVDGTPLPPSKLRAAPVPVRGLAPRGRGPEIRWLVESAGPLLARLEDWFGIGYAYGKLDLVAVPDYLYGAMENPGAITFAERDALFPSGRVEPTRRANAAYTLAHEEAHQWFGDLVTLPWWDEAWLNEAFATWLGSKIVDAWDPSLEDGLDKLAAADRAMGIDALVAAHAIRQPIASMPAAESAFDAITYIKGAAVLGMFERWVGDETFRAGIHDYLAARVDGSGSTEAMLEAVGRAAGRDVATPMRTFLDQAGVPLVEAELACDGKPRVKLRQSRFVPVGSRAAAGQRWQIPLCVRLPGKMHKCTLLTTETAELPLDACPAWVMPNADGAGYYRWTLPAKDFAALVDKGLPELDVRERISVADAVAAAVSGGAMPAATALAALPSLARDPSPLVAGAALRLGDRLVDRLVEPSRLPAAEHFLVETWAPVLRGLGWTPASGEPASRRELRGGVVASLVEVARDPATTRAAAALGRKIVGGPALDKRAADGELVVASVAAAIDADPALFDHVVALLVGEHEKTWRRYLLHALGLVTDPTVAPRALALMLDERLHPDEAASPLMMAGMRRRTREAAWRWQQANVDALLAREPPLYRRFVAMPFAGFCDEAHADALEALLRPRAARLESTQMLDQAVESVRLCSALATAQKASLEAFFK